MRARCHIGLSLGKLGSLMDGLGEYSSQICHHIAEQAPEWSDRWGVRFHIHLPERWVGVFGDHVSYLPLRSWQSRVHVQPRRFDVWHALHQLGRIPAPLGARHRILTIHDLNALYHDAPEEAAAAVHKLQRRLAGFETVTTMTHYVEGDIRRHLGWTGPVHIIPNGIRDLSTAPQETIPERVGQPYFFHISRLSRSKNPDLLLDLAALWPDRHWVFAGPASDDSRRLKAAVHERQLSHVTVLESISDAQKAWLYANCEAFLFPSQTEGFGLPPLEAMCFGKPVFLSTCTCLPEVGGDAAAYWPALTAEAMREVMRQQLPRLQARSEAIRAHALGFRWTTAVQAYLELYRQGLGLPSSTVETRKSLI